MQTPPTAHKIAVLVFVRNRDGEHLLLQRRKAPNAGLWSPIGGKLETHLGESPHECAARETLEETGLRLPPERFHLFAMVSERAYEGGAHWLLFLFDCLDPVEALPAPINEGSFAFFSRPAVDDLALPDTDRAGLWPLFDRHRRGFVALRVDCTPGIPLELVFEQTLAPPPVREEPRVSS